MRVAGIDPGLKGGVAVLRDGEPELVVPLPVVGVKKKELDVFALVKILGPLGISGKPDLVIVEKGQAMPGQGVTSMFNYGKHCGKLEAVLETLRIPFQLVGPKAWKAVVLAGTAKDKDAAFKFCRQRWPDVSLLPTERSRVLHDGMADALCIAEFGLRQGTQP